jgi:hypothetical protein
MKKKILLIATLLLIAVLFFVNGKLKNSATPIKKAPTPSQLKEEVISVYSDHYSSISTDINPNWEQETVMSEIEVEGDRVMSYSNLNYQGIDFPYTDVSTMNYLHLDYYTVDATEFKFFLIADGENAYDIAATHGIKNGQWVSIDIPIRYFSNAGRDLTEAVQFKTVGNNNLFLDNLYFWKEPTTTDANASLSNLSVNGQTIQNFNTLKTNYNIELPYGTKNLPKIIATPSNELAAIAISSEENLPGDTTVLVTAQDGITTRRYTLSFSVDPTPSEGAPNPIQNEKNVISVYSDSFNSIATNINPGWGLQKTVMTEIEINGNKVMKCSNLDYQGIEYKPTNISTMEYLHLDYYTLDTTKFKFFLITSDNEKVYDVANREGIINGKWIGVDIPLDFFFTEVPDNYNTTAIQFKTVGNNNLFLDNLYFWK